MNRLQRTVKLIHEMSRSHITHLLRRKYKICKDLYLYLKHNICSIKLFQSVRFWCSPVDFLVLKLERQIEMKYPTATINPDNLATDMRETQIESQQARRFFQEEPAEPRRPFNRWAFVVILVMVIVIVELAMAT